MPRNRDESSISQSRGARKRPSVAEQIVWNALRGGKVGFKFRREHPIGPYRLDFYCAEAKLAIEMDGEQHDPMRDAKRDRYLAEFGIATHRIPNRRFFELDSEPYRDELIEVVRLCFARTLGNSGK